MRRSLYPWVACLASLALGATACRHAEGTPGSDRAAERLKMVNEQIEARGIKHAGVLAALRAVPRHAFVPVQHRDRAYDDRPLPIGLGQTISQPYIVAAMTELLDPQADDVVFEVGTGSGYQAAILARLVKHVYTVEIIPELAEQAKANLRSLGITNVTVYTRDGYRGDPEHAPFDGIIVTAAPKTVPKPLLEQLAPGASLVVPVGDLRQELVVHTKAKDGRIHERSVFGVRFVPMTGEAETKR